MSPEEHEIMRSVEDHYWWYRALRRHVVDSISRDFRGRLLDAGCGTGGTLAAVRARFPNAELFGVDSAERALQLTRERETSAQLQRADVDQLPFADEFFDCVLSI